MATDPIAEPLAALHGLVNQAGNTEEGINARLAASIAAGPYLEALTRTLVNEAREQGSTWDEIGEAFGTSPTNVKARFGSYRSYDDDDD